MEAVAVKHLMCISDEPNFRYETTSQPHIIEFILKHSAYDLCDLAEVIGGTITGLNSVLIGNMALSEHQSKKLFECFMILIGCC